MRTLNSRLGLLALAIFAFTGKASAQFVYGTSFEAAEGFIANQTLDQQGLDMLGVWNATPPENAWVVDEAARTGTQSVRLYPSLVGQTDASKIVSIRNLTQPVVNGRVSMMVAPSFFTPTGQTASAFTDFQFVKGSTNVSIKMGFESLETGGSRIIMKYGTSQPVNLAVVAPNAVAANQWYDFRFAWTWGSSQVDFFVNNSLVGGINNFICNCPLRSDQISMTHNRSHNAGTQGAYFDDLGLTAAVPEPGTMTALALGLAWVARKRKKKSA